MASPIADLPHDDLSVIARLRSGDASAVGALYDRHAPVLLAFAIKLTGDRDEAEEVVMDAFTQAWRDAARFDPARSSVGAWLTMITRSRALDRVRARGRRHRLAAAVAAEGPDATAGPAHIPPADRGVEQTERHAAVAAALATLPDAQRTAVELAFFDGLSHVEVAERLQQPLGTIKTRIRLGLLKLREQLAPFAKE
jgi:RNA polymerase sigma-70 factor (ECF subfamily)